jgi:hypothetical protein
MAYAGLWTVERELLTTSAMDLIPLKLAAAQLGLSAGYVRTLCRNRRVPGAVFDRHRWYVPDGAQVIRHASGLFRASESPTSKEARRTAEADARISRLAAALAAVELATTSDGTDGADGGVVGDGSPPGETE